MGVSSDTVVVAMSGGVDSSAAALLLAQSGNPVVGIAMQVWDYRNNQGNAKKATCCAPADFNDARSVADYFGFPFYVFDFEESFNEAVIDPFVNSYLNGFTPNPCMDCNRKVKFRELRKRAKSLGANKVATGHYARIKQLADGTYGLFTSRDSAKDQSYFLYALTQQDLKETLFPVGDMVKDDVRKFLAEHGLEVAHKEESQDICFVSGSVAKFIERKTGKKPEAGKILHKDGRELGEHDGIHNYTVGQRKGLGVSNPNPLYVLNIDSTSDVVTVGEKEHLAQEGFSVAGVNWISGKVPEQPIIANVKMRYRHQGIRCKITHGDNDTAHLSFIDDWSAVSPGQIAVFYKEEADEDGAVQVLGGGVIQKSS